MALFTTVLIAGINIAAALNAVVSAIVATALSMAAGALTKKSKSQTGALDFAQTVTRRLRNGQPLEILVGKRSVGGVGHFDDSYDTKREKAVSISVLSAKPCTAFHQLYLDGEPVDLAGDPTQGEVNVTSHFLGKADVPRVKVRIFLGDDNSGLGAYLATKFPDKFTGSDNFGDYCVMVIEGKNTNDDFDEDAQENYIPFHGSLPSAKAEMSGAKICDLSIAGASYDDESTYVYSANAAWIDGQYDYGWYSGVGEGRALIVGNGYPVELMGLEQVKSNAVYCDAEGFECSGLIRSGKTGDQDEIRKCYNADREEHAASVFSIPEGLRETYGEIDLSETVAFVSEYDEYGLSTEVYNEISTVYSEPDEQYGEKEMPIYAKAEWVANDNHIPRQLPLPLLFVTKVLQAGKLEKQEINISRYPATCTIEGLSAKYMNAKKGSLVTILGSDIEAVNGRVWIIKGYGRSSRFDVTLVLREYAGSAAFDFDEATETPNPSIQIPDTRPWPWVQPRVSASAAKVGEIQVTANDAIQSSLVANNNVVAVQGGIGGTDPIDYDPNYDPTYGGKYNID